MTRALLAALAVSLVLTGRLLHPPLAGAASIRHCGGKAELSVSAVSDQTLQVSLAPLDEKGSPRAGPPSTAFVALKTQEKLRRRELARPEEVLVGKLRVVVRAEPLTISVRDAKGKLVQELTIAEADGAVTFRTDAPVLGLGEGAKQFDRRGARYPMLNGQRAPFLATHGGTIPVPYLIGTDGWALFVRSPWGEFDLRGGQGRFLPRKQKRSEEPLVLYVSHVPEPAVALAEYCRLTGHPVMPPKWALGYMQSHRTLAGPGEPLQVVKTFRDKKLPLDAVIYLGTGYCPAGWNVGHGTLDFNPKTFDRPAETLEALGGSNCKVVLHVNRAPRNLHGASVGEKFASPVHISNYWARHREVFALGVAGWWPDDGDELPIEARLARHRCYYEGPLRERPNERPWSLHRNGYAGAQRYGGWIWSGDVQSRWATLAAHVPVGVNHSLSLTPFWGTDVGGFVPTKEFTGELYARWFQFAAFTPLFRSHGRTWKLRLPWGWNTGEFGPVEARDGPDRAELKNAAVEPVCRRYLELRYRLLPYNYTLVREACDTGLPPMRALWLHYADDKEAVQIGEEYLWGRDLLIAPVVEKGAKARRLYLPAGVWYDWWTGAKVAGPRWLERAVDLATMPIYVRAGAVVPLDPVRQYTGQPVSEPTTLQIYRGADGRFALYDDDGLSLDFLRGEGSWTRITWDDSKGRLVIEPDPRNAARVQPERTFEVAIHPGTARQRVRYAGKRVGLEF
jgi:alpha-glucosidase/alpha-D-xyloside xylohydrolase